MVRIRHLTAVLPALLLTAGAGRAGDASFLRAGDEIVCGGDSITFQNAYEEYVQNTLAVLYPEAKIRVVNQGANGASAGDRLGALKTYLETNTASVVTVMFGVNDTRWKADDIDNKKRDFAGALNGYADLCRDRGLPLVFLRESHWSHGAKMGEWEAGLNGALDALQAAQAAVAKERGVPLVDTRGAYERALAAAWRTDPRYEFTPDIIHPNSPGHVAIASEILRAFGAGLPLATGGGRGPVRVDRGGPIELSVAPAQGLLPARGELSVTVRVANASDQLVAGTLQAVIGTRLCTAVVKIPAKDSKDVVLGVPVDALPGRCQILPLYVAFASAQDFTAIGAPFFYSRTVPTTEKPFTADAVGPVANLQIRRTPEFVKVEFDWLDKTPVAARAGFKNRYGVVIPVPLDLKLRGSQPSDAVELLFDLRPPQSIGRPTADTDSNPEGMARLGLYRAQEGEKWVVKALAEPELKPERLRLAQQGDRVTVEFVPDTAEVIGFSMRVTDRAAWGQEEGMPACLTTKPGTGFEYMAFVQLGLGAESIFYRIGF